MAAVPDLSRSFRFNLDLVMNEIARWPAVTLAVLAALAAMTVFIPSNTSGKLDPTENAILLAGYLIGALGMKALWLLVTYPRLRKSAFPGSRIMASFIVFVPIFVFYAVGLYAAVKQTGDKPPLAGMVLFLLFSYLLFSVIFAGFMRAAHTIFMHKGKLSELVERGRRPAPLDSEPPAL